MLKTSKILAAAATALVVAVTAAPAMADRIDERQANQLRRIEHGWHSGKLTRSEYNRLMDQQREIARLERILQRDGRLSYSDRARLNYLLNQASVAIYWEKHDGQNRGDGWGRGRGDRYGYGYGNGYGRGHRDADWDTGRYPRRWYQWY